MLVHVADRNLVRGFGFIVGPVRVDYPIILFHLRLRDHSWLRRCCSAIAVPRLQLASATRPLVFTRNRLKCQALSAAGTALSTWPRRCSRDKPSHLWPDGFKRGQVEPMEI